MKSVFLSAIAVICANTAIAGGYQAPVVDVAPTVVNAAAPAGIDWTGFYAGLQYGRGDGDISYGSGSIALGDYDSYGLHAGYLADKGQYVLGGELDFNRIDADGGRAEFWRLKGRLGADLGKFLPYVTMGVAHYSETGLSETGLVYGLGLEYLVAERFSIGAEYTRNSFSDVGDIDGLEFDADAVQLRASFRF